MMATDWEAIKAEYFQGTISLQELADKHDISFSTITKRSAKEEWKEKKQEIGKIAETKIIEKIAKSKAEEISTLNTAYLQISKKTYNKLNEMLNTAATTHDVRRIVSSLAQLQQISRVSLGADKEDGGEDDIIQIVGGLE